jgi:hypothetical protein
VGIRLHHRQHRGDDRARLRPGRHRDPLRVRPRIFLVDGTSSRSPPSTAAKTRAKPRTRRPDLTDVDKAVTYLSNNHQYMRYDKALAGRPIATGMTEGACRFVIEDRFGITGARWSPDGAEVILKLRAVVINGDLDDHMNYSHPLTCTSPSRPAGANTACGDSP